MNNEPNKEVCTNRNKAFWKRVHDSLFFEMPKWFDEVVFHSRWLLYPAVIGLVVVDVALLLSFFYDLWHFVVSVGRALYNGQTPDFTIPVFSLVEQALKMTVVILVAMGTHQIYIRRFREDRQIHDIPQWLDHIDTVFLKVKVGLALSVVSGFQALQDGTSDVPREVWLRHCGNTVLFVLMTVLFAVVWRLMHPPHPAHPVDVERMNNNNRKNGRNGLNGREEAEVTDRCTND